MTVPIICIVVGVVLVIITLVLLITYNRIQEFIIRINEADASIDAVLSKRFDLLNKSVDFIKEVSDIEDTATILPTIVQLRSQSLSNTELDKKLYAAIHEFQSYADKYEGLKTNEGYVKTQIHLMESESEITALRKYYNDITKDYNKLLRTIPARIVSLLKKYTKKEYFEDQVEKKNILAELKA